MRYPFPERLFGRLIIDVDSECVLWTGSVDSKGYGQIKVGGRSSKVHRVMYEMFAGPIPADLELDHLCRVRRCANVGHLQPVTSRENSLRGIGIPAENAVKDRCPAGHPYDEANTRIYGGRRYCRACHLAHSRAHRQRRTAS